MRTLLKNGYVINVFTDEIEKTNVLIEDDKIIGVGEYTEDDADVTEDVSGKYVCPGFIDGHIHIESTMLLPSGLASVCVPHGTTSVIADPHEIANVCGVDGIKFMLEASEGIPLGVYIVLPSCVPATPFDESGAVLKAEDLERLYKHERVIGLGEMMNYPGVIHGDVDVHAKLSSAFSKNKVINGHAPLLTGKDLDKYISYGINDDHECSSIAEAKERIKKGQWIMLREGTAAKNLADLLDLFEEPYNRRTILVTDDRHPADLIEEGHIDNIIRTAAANGKNVLTAIRMATIQAAQCMRLQYLGAIAPGYKADVLVLDELDTVKVKDVFKSGKKVVENGKIKEFSPPKIATRLLNKVKSSFKLKVLTKDDFFIKPESQLCRVIEVIPNQILTNEVIRKIDFEKKNGIDTDVDTLKLAVIERHNNTGHIGLGYVTGIGLKDGAIASSVAHDSHNLIVVGANDEDMVIAANRIRELGGGYVAVKNEQIIAEMPLPFGGLMSDLDAFKVSNINKELRDSLYNLGVSDDIDPLMTMAFVSLPVIPIVKMSTYGLIDVGKWQKVSLFV